MPMDELCERDSDENEYKNQSLKRKGTASRKNSSFIRRVLQSGFAQSVRRKSRKAAASRSWPDHQEGIINPAFSMNEEVSDVATNSMQNSPPGAKRSSLRNLVKKISPANKGSSMKYKQHNPMRQNSYTASEKQNSEILYDRQNSSKDCENETIIWSVKPEEDGMEG